MIEGARTAISPLPESRLDRELFYHPEKGRIGSTYTDLSGVVPETPFDHNRYAIPDELASSYDSVHLRMLEVCCEAVTSAGMDPLTDLAGSRTGVFIGNTSGSTMAGDLTFGTLSREVIARLNDPVFDDVPAHIRERAIQNALNYIQSTTPVRNARGGPNVEAHDVSVLVSRAMQLDGPTAAVDAACASALMSTTQAVCALQRGHLDMAIAGGCSFSKWFALILFSQAQSVSGTGTRPFDKNADGLISSDGYAAIVLKPLDKALADGDQVMSVIRSLAVGSDGKGKSLWAPRREGQIHAVRRAYSDEVTPDSLQYIECHATSTQVGDATEISALSEAMDGAFAPGRRIPIGSVKGNIGHTLECAGLAGICKTIQALRHGVVPPQPSISELNPDIAWNDIPFYVPTSPEPWTDTNEKGVRRAAVNAFGIGGLNGHFVLDDRPEPQPVTQSAVPADVTPETKSADDDLIAVIGVGVIAPDANNEDEFWSLISSGRSAISEVTDDRWLSDIYLQNEAAPQGTTSKLGGFIRSFEFDWKKHRIPPKQIQNSNPLQYMLLDAADQAFIDAGLGDMNFPKERASVVVGTRFGGDFASHMQGGLRLPVIQREFKTSLIADGLDEAQADEIVARYREHALGLYPAIRDETGSFTSSTLASRLTKAFDMMGGAWAVDASDVSSFVCLQAAADMLLTGASDMVMCAAGQRSMDVSSFELIDLHGNLSHDGASPAFDAAQDGGVPGEAVGVVLLKRLSDAERDGDRIRCVIRSVEMSFSDKDTKSAVAKNLKRVLPADGSAVRIDAIETARVCDPELDAAELQGLQQALLPQSASLSLGSTSKQIGYSLSASGMISVIKAILELEHQSVAPVGADAQPSELLRNCDGQFLLPQQTMPLGSQLPPGCGRILVSNIDPAGAVGHLVIEGVKEHMNKSAPAAPAPAAASVASAKSGSVQTLRMAAATTAELETAIAAGRIDDVSTFRSADALRVGIVATSADDLKRKLPAARLGLADSQRRHILGDNGILIMEPGQAGQHIAVVFSGQGAQYSGMLTDWMESSPAVRAFIREANEVLASMQLPSFEYLTQDESAGLGEHVLNTQLAVLVADLAAWAALQEVGVQPDFIAGHSYGEYPALVAAGAWDLRAAVQATLHRTNAVEGAGATNAAMVSTTAPPNTVTQLIQKLQLPCDIACYNAPDQTIIAGRISDLDQLSEELKAGGFMSRTIRVPMPYHSRLMQPAQAPLAAALQQIPVNPPSIRFISCGTNRPLETPDEIRSNLVAELVEPVRWHTLVETLIASNAGVIVESGPRQILTRLNRGIIGARPVMHLALDARPGHAAEQQARVRLLLEMVRGAAPQPASPPSAAPAVPQPAAAAPARPTAPPAHTPTAIQTSPEALSMTDQRTKGRIAWIDATERRRAKMREAAQAKAAGKPSSGKASSNGVLPPAQNEQADSNNGVVPTSAPQPQAATPAPVAPAPVAATAPTPATVAAVTATMTQPAATRSAPAQELSRDKLESFVLDYVVEQTGYPPELVELDANLEADLGVDSIRKAQLMGEITETFEIEQAKDHINDLSLDDFPDLNSVIEFFLKISESPDAAQTAAPVAPTAPPAPPAPAAAPVSSAPAAAAPASSAAVPVATGAPAAISRDELQKFAISFVVEQTGYPEELVELDTDLEADLGIDSIRKAQLLGEIAEQYQMTSLAGQITDLSLDDFSTLNSIVDFFVAQSSGTPAAEPPPAASAPAPAPVAVAPTAPAPVAPVAAAPVATAPVAETSPAINVTKEELIQFAIAFVVEQTGYPEELVEPTADLEADLGIDSIRKAQLLGEIAEHYQMTSLAGQITDLSLDDFPTLEAITDFFFEAAGRTTKHGADTDSSSIAATEPTATVTTAATLTPFARVPESDRIMQRYIVRSMPAALPEALDTTGTAFAGKVVILGDNEDAQALAERLQSAGSTVEIIAATPHEAAVVSQFEASWNQQPVQHLVVMTSSSEQPADWPTLRDQQLLVPYFVIQRWVQLRLEAAGKETPPAGQLAAVTRLGGDFGIGRRIGNISGAGLAGLFKGIIREHAELNATVLDAPADEPARLVIDALCQEAAALRPTVEIGTIRGKRHRLQMIPQPASGIPRTDDSLAGPWVVTGGARGITARIAAALGRTAGVRLHLVGRSPEPEIDPAWVALDEAGLGELKKDVMRKAAADGKKPIDVWNSVSRKINLAKSLQELRDEGLDVTYHACDVSDRGSVGSMLQAVRDLHGPITGVIHGAGIEAAARFDRKKADSVRLTVTSKVDGARWLWEHTAGDNLKYYVGFGSTSGRFGGLGQTDYSMSSDLLCRMGWQFGTERPDCRVFGIHWPAWGEVGMAARPESRFALESAGLKFVEPDEGISHLLDEFDIAVNDGEVAIVDRVWGVSDEEVQRDAEFIQSAHRSKTQVAASSFVETVIRCSTDSITTELLIDPTKHMIVADHMVDSTPVVPGVMMLEICLQTAELLAPDRLIVEVQDFEVYNGIWCRSGMPQLTHTTATRQSDGSISCQLTSVFTDQRNRIVDPARRIAELRVFTGTSYLPGSSQDELPGEWETLTPATDPMNFDRRHSGTVYHGPSMQRLAGISEATDESAWFRLAELPSEMSPEGTKRPSIIDSILQGGDIIAQRSKATDQLLRGADRIIFHQDLRTQGELISHSQLVAEENGSAVWSERCFAIDGTAVMSTESHRSFQLKNRLSQNNQHSNDPVAGSAPAPAVAPVSAAAESPKRPMMARAGIEIEGQAAVVTFPVDPVADRFLREHTLHKVPLLPAVMGLEFLTEASEVLGTPGERAVAVRNMTIHTGIKCINSQPRVLTVRCQRNGPDVTAGLFESPEATNPSMTATVVLGNSFTPLTSKLSKPHGEFMDYPYPKDAPIQHGPSFQTLRKLAAWRFLGSVELQVGDLCLADDFPADTEWVIDPAILDGLLVACGSDAWLYYGFTPELPHGFDEIILGHPPHAREACAAEYRCQTTFKEDVTTYDVVLQDSEQRTFMQLNGLHVKRLMPVKPGWLTMGVELIASGKAGY